ncbi:xanthine dehydrogenase family protein molybdopterin-binding subunit [Granulicella sp. dw_53]|uniref:xanthine dehydrogenase family protein molybdopterin-binding subunit n=1 Tax=Granulicella sp. dw_53 TaxID=2719792 RepID=UPI001BD2E0CD|nr:xanthine dehydrogenase family protein molybdopterin-binding subunit [Granulicella sp. dw_53]
MPDLLQTVGFSPIRKEGAAKVLGQAKYVDDLSFPGMWFGATVRSSIARGRIVSITFDPAIPWDEFVIVTAADIPGQNTIVHLTHDHRCLASDRVNHPDEPILLLAHPDRAVLPAAVAGVHITYKELPGVFTIEESEAPNAPAIWSPAPADHQHSTQKNTFKTYLMESGDTSNLDHIFATADYIVEGEYRTGAQEQLYIENNGVIAEYSATDGVTVHGSLQCPYYLVHALELVFNLPEEKCRVIQTETGGAFGGKEDFPSVIGSHAALLAMKSGHPVKICYDRAEDMAGTTKRHPSRSRHRTAVSKDGKILAGEIDFALDGGAYATLTPVVLSRGTIHAPGPYHWPALRVRAKAMATNLPPHGAFRGFGAPQSIFATERHMNKIAKVVGLSPEELRRRNLLGIGDHTATGQLITDTVNMQHLLTRALDESSYHAKRAEFARTNPSSPIKRGMGFATFFHGAGFTGSGERRLNSLVHIELTPEGRPQILVSATEFGQGTNTILCQVAAETLHLPYEDVLIAQPDTSHVPNSGPTVASRTAMIVGKLVERASQSLRNTLSPYLPSTSETSTTPYTPAEFRSAALAYLAEHGTLVASARYEAPGDILWDDESYRGAAYPAYAWAVYVAEVAVDTTTYSATCTDFYALQEVGKVLHPVLAKGQIEGGVAQGIGYALYEKCVWQKGHMANNQMTNYIMPTSADLPPIRVAFEEIPSVHGPFGAKGIGELPMDGPAPAILNAIEDATGIAFTEIPLLPEDIFERMTSTPESGSEDLEPTNAGPYFSETTA